MTLPEADPTPAKPWQKWTHQHGGGGMALLVALLLLFAGSLTFSIEAEKPWGKTVQKRLAKSSKLEYKEHAIVGLWWASVASAGVTAALLASFPWWLPRRREWKRGSQKSDMDSKSSPPPSAGTKWFWGGILFIMLFGAWERWPRLDHSLWNDEEYSLRSYTHGEWVHNEDGTATFKPLPWMKTLFANEHGNNHLFTAAASRISLSVWRSATGATEGDFSETALRMPSFVGSMVTIMLIGWIGLQMGGPIVGLASAALMATSPWHIRYSGESKGYAVMMAFMVLHLVAIIQIHRTRKVGWWLVFSLAQAGYLLSFAGSLYVAVCINLLLTLECLLNRDGRKFLELTAFNLLAAIPVMWWMFPTIPQLLGYLTDDKMPRLDMGWPWIWDLLSGWAIGWGHQNPQITQHFGTSWVQEAEHANWAWKGLFLVVLPILALAGIIASLVKKPLSLSLGVIALTLAGGLAYTHNALSQTPMWVWYLIYTVIPMVLMIPLGLQWLTSRVKYLGPALILLLVVGLEAATWGPSQRIRDHDRQPIRETVEFVRQRSPHAITGTFGVSDRQAESYDHAVHVLKAASDLDQLVTRSKAESKPLYVYLCGESITSERHPELFQRVKASGEFEELTYLPGTEAMFSYHVYRLR